MTSTKYYPMMEKPHRPDNTNPGGSANDAFSHARRPNGVYLNGRNPVIR
jgi:hypothetical protein